MTSKPSHTLDALYTTLQTTIAALEQNPGEQTGLAAHKAWRVFLDGERRGIHRQEMLCPGLLNAFSAEQFAPLVRTLKLTSVRDFEARLKMDIKRLKGGMTRALAGGGPRSLLQDFKMPDLDAHLPALSAFSDAVADYKQSLPPESLAEKPADWRTRTTLANSVKTWAKG